MKILITRHGETIDNALGLITGQQQGELTSEGRTQAKHLGEKLKEWKFDTIYSSDLTRARKTTEYITRYHDNSVIFTEALRELHYGEFQGRSLQEYLKFRDEGALPSHEFIPAGGESHVNLDARVAGFLESLDLTSKNTVLISAHGVVNRMLLRNLLKLSFEEARVLPQENTCINILEYRSGAMSLEVFNSVDHLGREN